MQIVYLVLSLVTGPATQVQLVNLNFTNYGPPRQVRSVSCFFHPGFGPLGTPAKVYNLDLSCYVHLPLTKPIRRQVMFYNSIVTLYLALWPITRQVMYPKEINYRGPQPTSGVCPRWRDCPHTP